MNPGSTRWILAIQLVLSVASLGLSAVPNVILNEIAANPGQGSDDWIELYNPGPRSFDIGGMYLTNDLAAPTLWKIKSGTAVPGKGWLWIWLGAQTTAAGLHANFDLSADGGQVGLFDRDGVTLIDSKTFSRQDPGVSLGRYPDGGPDWLLFGSPSPGAANKNPYLGEVGEVAFSHDHGFFDAPFSVTLTTETTDAVIFYTLDGSSPLGDQGDIRVYIEPIPISTTTCLRAAAILDGWKSSHVQTRTYLYLKDVIRQPKNPSAFPKDWGSAAADYEMDPRITNSSKYSSLMERALLSLPTVSLVLPPDALFGPTGIYTNSTQSGFAWERQSSVEWISPSGGMEFQVDAGLRIYGGAFRGMGLTRKKSFRLSFKGEYGPTKLEFPVFDAPDATTRFDTLIFRAGANDAWNNWGNVNTQYIVDEFMRRTQLAVGQPSAHGTFVHLYLNGLYWGLYNLTERPNASFSSTYLGGKKEEWDYLNAGIPQGQGNGTTWNAMFGLVRAGLSDNASYQKIQGNNPDGTRNPAYDDLLDVNNYVDYIFHNFWGGTGDWPWHNYYAACRRPPNTTGFKFFDWDAEGAIIIWSSLTADVTGVSDGVAEPLKYLRQNEEFRLLFGDHSHRHLFNGGAATAAASASRYKGLADLVELGVIAESARWGDQAQVTPYTVDDWRARRDYILNTYMVQRPAIVLDQLRAAGLYPKVEAPMFQVNASSPASDHISATDRVGMAAPKGKIYYTLDGSDPRVPIARSTPGPVVTLVPENVAKKVLVPSASNSGSQLGNKPAGFQVTYYKENLTVSSLDVAESVISNPANRTATVTQTSQTINFFNSGSPGNFANDQPFPGTTTAVDVDNFVILVTGTILIPQAGPWTFGVSSDDGFGVRLTGASQSFTLSYPSPRGPGDTLGVFNVTKTGTYQLRLVFYEQGGGSELELYAGKGAFSSFTSTGLRLVGDPAAGIQVGEGNIWFTTTFDDSSWTKGSGGVGYERGSGYQGLIGLDVAGDMAGKNSTCYIRIPFTADNAVYGDLRLRVRYDDGFIAYLNGVEVARRNFTGDPTWNSTAGSQHSDTAAAVPEEIDITPYVGALGVGANVLAIHGLNVAAGDDDFLISAELTARRLTQGDVSATAAEFKSPFTLPRSTRVRARSLDTQWSALNEEVFAVGPVAEGLRISEIMYHPEDTGDPNDPNTEFIELKNVSSQAINLNLVCFTQGIHCTFADTGLQAGQVVLVVKDQHAFTAKYGQGLPVAGAYEGSLSNGGDRIVLKDAAGKVIHDFSYCDNWIDRTDGGGYSLVVKDPAAIGTQPGALGNKALWQASPVKGGTPGY
jgi:hypothetical protein